MAPLPQPHRPARTRRRLLLAIGMVMLGATSLPAQRRTAQETIYHPAEPPLEHYTPTVLVGSDEMLVGLQMTGTGDPLPSTERYVVLPPGGQESLCVYVRSIDGRYRGEFRYRLNGLQRGRVRIDIGSRRAPAEVAAYRPEELAITASTAASCSSPTRAFLPVSATRAITRTVRVALNADAGMIVRAEVAAAGAPPSASPARCPVVGAGNAHAFNRVCSVDLPPAAGRYILRLTLRIPGQEARYVTYPVEIP